MFQEIYIIDENDDLANELKEFFKEDMTYKFKRISTNNTNVVFKNIPELIIINENNCNMLAEEICKTIRNNEDNSITPIIVYSSNNEIKHKLEIMSNNIEYYVEKDFGIEYFTAIIRNITRLLMVNRTVSPLTGLPGNLQIQTELKKRLLRSEPFAVLYLDLDNFKAYNDTYGFVKGDEVIKLTAKIIAKHVHNIKDADTFIGHIGGDDFVAVLDNTVDIDNICQNIIAEFDKSMLSYLNDDDIDRGYFEVRNRKGILEEFGLTSISIGIVVADPQRFANILEIGEVGAQVKKLAKQTPGSCYVVNRRVRRD